MVGAEGRQEERERPGAPRAGVGGWGFLLSTMGAH